MHIVKGPYLQKPTQNTITVMWETDVSATSEVNLYHTYCPHSFIGLPIIGEAVHFTGESGTLHTITLEGLSAGQDYYYEVISQNGQDSVTSEKHSMRTAPSENTPFSFVLSAENGACGPYTKPIIDLIQKEHPDFILSVGDLVSDGSCPDSWNSILFSPFREIFYNTPFYPCVGNHEIGYDIDGYYVKPEESDQKLTPFHENFAFPHYYSFDYGCAHFCVLDSPSMMKNICSTEQDYALLELLDDFENSEQYRFLEQELARTKAKWKFVIFHYPPYVSAINDVRELKILSPVMEKYKVDMVFNSHSIVYERSHPIKQDRYDKDGIRYVVVGSFGEYESWFREKSNGFAAKVSSRPCYVRIAVTPGSLELQTIDHEGKLFDSLLLEK